MVPTLAVTLGIKGHPRTAATRDSKDLLYVFAVLNLISGVLHSNTLESPKDAKKKPASARTEGCRRRSWITCGTSAASIGKTKHPEVVLLIDNAPWHRGKPIDAVLAESPHVKLKRLPSYSPQLNPIERFCKKLQRRATHNRLFEQLSDLKKCCGAACATSRPCGKRSSPFCSHAPV